MIETSIGIFETASDLSIALGKSPNYVSYMRCMHSGYDYEDVINLSRNNDRTVVCKLGTFPSMKDLSVAIGRSDGYLASCVHRYPELTIDEIINHLDLQLTDECYVKPRGSITPTPVVCSLGTFKSQSEFSICCGYSKNRLSVFYKRHPEMDIEEMIERFKLSIKYVPVGKTLKGGKVC